MYVLRHGANERKLIEISVREGKPLPDFIVNAPKPDFGNELFLAAFFDLMHDRNELGPIHWTTINQWCASREIEMDQQLIIEKVLRSLDSVYTNFMMEERKKLAKQKPKPEPVRSKPVRRR